MDGSQLEMLRGPGECGYEPSRVRSVGDQKSSLMNNNWVSHFYTCVQWRDWNPPSMSGMTEAFGPTDFDHVYCSALDYFQCMINIL